MIVPFPVATISRQPIRPEYEVSVNVIVDDSLARGASAAVYAHVRRSVDRPPAPGGNPTDDAPAVSDTGDPLRSSSRLLASAAQAPGAQAAASSSPTLP